MKHPLLIIILFTITLPKQIFAQQNQDSCCISQKELTGIWQRNNKIVGNGLGQNFEFYENGTFVLNLGNESDDLRNTIQLKGKYRLDKDKLFFTITSKTIVEGKIELADGGISLSLFEIVDWKEKEIKELQPKEFKDPCYITLFSEGHIKLNNEVYYKIK